MTRSLELKGLVAALVLGTVLPAEGADPAVTQLRFLSHATRDHAPTVAEAKAFHEETDKDAALQALTAQWLESDAHKARVARHFDDLFGMEAWTFLADDVFDLVRYDPSDPWSVAEKPADLTEAGVYFLKKGVKPTCGAPVTAPAWWSDAPIRICATATSAATVFQNGAVRCTDGGAGGIRHASCGCGPEQLICLPADKKGRVMAAVTQEFKRRALHAYEADASWLELLGGDLFVGDRWLYHHYLYQEKLVTGAPATAAEIAYLKALPLAGATSVRLPRGATAERSGVVTSPGFLRRFNNFRSRIRALTDGLLCQDVDEGLDPTAAAAGLVNPTLSAFDREHGTREDCAGCHYPMDNLGSTILHWSDLGFYESWKPDRSQLGWVFGERGSGPRFLMEGYVTRDARFLPCMAKRAYEDFSGGARWADLGEAERQSFVALAAEGPRGLIRGLLTSATFRRLRAAGGGVTGGGEPRPDFAAEVAPVVARACAACHPGWAEDEATFRAVDAGRIASGSMPPPGAAEQLTDAERALLVRYLTAE